MMPFASNTARVSIRRRSLAPVLIAVTAMTTAVQAQVPGYGPPIFNYAPPQAAPGAAGDAQAGYDDLDSYKPDAVKSRNLPVREDAMQPQVRARFESFISEVQEP